MSADPTEAAEAPTFLQLLACSASLRLTCRDCGAICQPNIGKVAVRVGLQNRFDDRVKVRCARCTSDNTVVDVQYPSDYEPPRA